MKALTQDTDTETEALVQRIIDTLSFRFSPDASPVSVLYWSDKYDFTAAQWRRIEETVTFLADLVTEQRKQTEEYERKTTGKKGEGLNEQNNSRRSAG